MKTFPWCKIPVLLYILSYSVLHYSLCLTVRLCLSVFSTDVIETDFLKYRHTVEGNAGGGAETDIGSGNLNIEAKGSSKLASSFGSLKKQEVDVQKLLSDSKTR